jgi:hypothetical protein
MLFKNTVYSNRIVTNRYIQGTYKWYVRGRGNKDKHEAFHGYAVCISLILGSTLQSYPWYITVLVGSVIADNWKFSGVV